LIRSAFRKSRGGHLTVSTVSIGSNQKYAENWDTIFKTRKATKKKAAPAKGKSKAESRAAPKKKAKSHKPAGKTAKRKR
jgi:hypothetical protein